MPHQPPFYCPYCGEEDIRPAEKHGEWTCLSCRRAWALRFLGLAGTGSPERVNPRPSSVSD